MHSKKMIAVVQQDDYFQFFLFRFRLSRDLRPIIKDIYSFLYEHKWNKQEMSVSFPVKRGSSA